jgi:hypothetical protein
MKQKMKGLFSLKKLFSLTLVLAIFIGAASVFAAPWRFGVMSDTQWTVATDPAGQNPNAVPVSIINQINQQFIIQGVKFVIQVGDLTENGNDADEATRAAAAQPLINAGIGFFPMRGNHETYANPPNGYAIAVFQSNYPQTRGISNTFGTTNFSSPTSVSADLTGMSYSFDYGTAGNNTRFVIIDNWVTPSKNVAPGNGYNYGYSIADQQAWISSRLDKNTRGTEHAFIFSHQPLIAENHQDSPFVGYTNANPDMQNAFFASLQNDGVRYYISGHDHMHQRSIITSPDGKSEVEEIIGASNSSKFYTPKSLTDANWFGQKTRETPLSQELYTVGYYIYTVDGPCVTVDYYSDTHGNWQSDSKYPDGSGLADTGITPTFYFVKKETWGYCLNGKEFLVAQGKPYDIVQDSYSGTTAKILGGTNASTAKDYNGRALTKAVDTGWSPKACCTASNILTLRGMASNLGSSQTDVYTLSMSYDSKGLKATDLKKGLIGMATRDENCNWVNAVDYNIGGTKKFVFGPWDASYGLGSYGVDQKTKTAWAVVNYEGEFAVAPFSTE